jgi:hypothetical protein
VPEITPAGGISQWLAAADTQAKSDDDEEDEDE